MSMRKMAALAAAAAVAFHSVADTNITENVTLVADADWSDQGTVIIAQGATVDLNGHTLKVKGLHCNGSIVDGSAIPGYALLDYIESSGTQWINTGFTTTAETAIEMDFTTLADNGNHAYFCGDWAVNGHLLVANGGNFCFFGISHNVGAFSANRHLKIQTIPGGGKTVVLSDGDTGAEIGSSNVALTHSGTGEMTIFAADSGLYASSFRLHGFKLTHHGTVVRDFVPVRRNADGAAGLYDRATKAFFGNAGSGSFAGGDVSNGKLVIDISGGASYAVDGACEAPVSVEGGTLGGDVDLRGFGNMLEFAGTVYLNGHRLSVAALSGTEDIANIPGTYRRLSYIESNGTQWINTGFTTTAETAIEMDFTTLADNGNHAYFCGDWAVNGHLLVANGGNFCFFGISHNVGAFSANRHLKIQTIPGGGKTVVLSNGDTGVEIGSSSVALTHGGTGEMTLFAADSSGLYAASFRLHGFKLTHQGTVVRDFVPVERTADGRPGLYDLANDVFYPSNGSADFAMGHGTGEFMGLEDSGAAGVFRVDVAAGARVENVVATISGNVCFAKGGAGEYVERVVQKNTGGVTLEGGTFSWGLDAPAVAGALTFAGGTLAIEDGHSVTVQGGASVTAPSAVAFRRGAKFGRRAAIAGFGAETPLAQLSLVVTPDPECATGLVLDGDDLQVALGGAGDAVEAVWTGAADAAASNPANWHCTNLAGEQVANALPSRLTTVHIAGTVALQIPSDSGFVCADVVLGDCTLAADCDWRGLGTLPVSGTIDLAGHRLYTSGVTGAGTITSGDPNGYRFYRFKVDATGGNDFQISVIQLYSGDLHITDLRKALHWRQDNFPAQFASEYNPEKAFDGNTATKWYDNRSKDDIWVTVEYETPVFVTRYDWYTADDTAKVPVRNPTAWRLQASNDNATWTDLEVVTGATPPAANKTIAHRGHVNSNLGGDGGELHVDVAEGTCQTNSTVALSGRLKLVKDGAGTLVCAKTGQSYGGGTTVAAGYIKPGFAQDNSLFGAGCSTITVEDGAQFLDDVFCMGVTCDVDWVIAGSGPDGTGAIRATARAPGAKNNAEVAWGRSLTLAGDATIGRDEYAFDFIAPNYIAFPVALVGHTLTLKSSRPTAMQQAPFFLASSVQGTDAGTIVVGENLCFYPYRDSASVLPNVTLVISAGAEYRTDQNANARDMTVSNLVYRSASAVSQTARTTTVLGTYTPASVASVPKVVLGDARHLAVGLDLSERTTEFDVSFGGGFTFTEGSVVKVNLGTRRRRQSERLVAWTEKPVGVTFTGETLRDRFEVRDDGLYLAGGTLVIVR